MVHEWLFSMPPSDRQEGMQSIIDIVLDFIFNGKKFSKFFKSFFNMISVFLYMPKK